MLSLESLLTTLVQTASERWFTAVREEKARNAQLVVQQEERVSRRYLDIVERNSYDDGHTGEQQALHDDWIATGHEYSDMSNAKENCNGIVAVKEVNHSYANQRGQNLKQLLERERNLRQGNDRRQAIPGQKHFAHNKHVRRVNLPTANVPSLVFDVMERQQPFELFYPVLKEVLCPVNYIAKFQTLLWIEEARARVDMRQYDMDNVIFSRSTTYLELVVPGLVDNRPSLVVGDLIYAESPASSDSERYEGYIHAVSVVIVISVTFILDFHPRSLTTKSWCSSRNIFMKLTTASVTTCHFKARECATSGVISLCNPFVS